MKGNTGKKLLILLYYFRNLPSSSDKDKFIHVFNPLITHEFQK